MLSEGIQDEGGTVDDFDADNALQGAASGGSELAVDDHRIGSDRGHHVGQLTCLTIAQIGGGIGVAAPLDEGVENLASSGLGQGGQLVQGGIGVLDAMRLQSAASRGSGPVGAGQLQIDQNDLLQTDLVVLGLANIPRLGGQAGHTTTRGAGLVLKSAFIGTGAVVAVDLLPVLDDGGSQGGPGPGGSPDNDVAHVATFLNAMDIVEGRGGTGVVLGHKKSFTICPRLFDRAR